jgi:hypothetical protein
MKTPVLLEILWKHDVIDKDTVKSSTCSGQIK